MKPPIIENRTIRVFISSTFQDMQDERDELMKKTFPMLRQMAAERDVTLTEIDLRWGITEEESKSGKVVEICLREIENSVPFFIGIIGNRYGWIPKPEDLGGGSLTERFPKVPEYVERHLSVTEMEMQFGVLARPEDIHAYFFIKEPEIPDKEEPEKLAALKEAVRKNKRYPVSTYSSREDLSRQVEEAFKKLLDEVFPEDALSALEKERLGQRAYMNSLCQFYIRTEKNYAAIDKWIEDWEKHQLVITGASGLGKSALVANWTRDKLTKKKNLPYKIVYHAIGSGGSLGSDWHVVKSLCDEIRDLYGFDTDETSPKTDEKALKELFDRVAFEGDKPLLIVLDAINQIVDINHAKRLNWLPIPPKNVKILFTTLEADETMQVFQDRHYSVFTLRPLTRRERIRMVRKYLSIFSKKLKPEQVARIVDDRQSDNTLVMKTLLDELINFGIYEKLDEKIEEFLMPDSYEDFYQVLLQNYEASFGEQSVRHFLSLIAVSRNGLSEDEILSITQEKRLHWSQFYCSFRQHLIVKNGLVSFSHSHIREALEGRYINGCEDWVKTCREEIVAALENETTPEGKKTTRSMDEVPYQYDRLGEWDKLHDYIIDYHYLFYCTKRNEVEIGTYWRHIEEYLPEKYSLRDYLNNQECEDKVLFYTQLMRLCIVRCYPKIGEEVAHLLINHIKESPSVATPEVYIALSCALHHKEKIKYAEEAIRLSKEQNDTQNEVASYRVLGSAYYEAAVIENDDHYSQMAYDVWEKEKDLSIELYGELHPMVMHCYEDLSMVCDDLDQALKLAFKSLEISMALYGPNHPLTGRPYHYVGVIYREQKNWGKALFYFEKACQVWTTAYGINHELLYASYVNQGNALTNLGRLEDAPKCFDTCLQIIDVIFDELVYEHAICHLKKAKIFTTLGRRKEAVSECEKGEVVLKQNSVALQQRSKSLVEAFNSLKSTI